MKRMILYVIPLLIFNSCLYELPTIPELFIDMEELDENYTELSDSSKHFMNGVYSVISGKSILGEEVVGKWTGKRWCLYSKHDVVFSENAGGIIEEEDSIIFTGYIREVRVGSGFQVDFYISPDDGASDLNKGIKPHLLRIIGITSEGKPIILVWKRPLYNPDRKFYILAHRGGGRNSERLGLSENSIKMLLHAEVFGANGVEIDVKRTRDGKLILFHDDTFSPRTVLGAYLLGKVENFDLVQIQKFGRLINGEPIPTLDEALKAIIQKTNLSLVWLDIKEPGVVAPALSAQKNALKLAAEKNRDIEILLGMPDEDVLNAFSSSSGKDTVNKILIELGSDVALSRKDYCRAWAPRWTNGSKVIDAQVTEMNQNRIHVFTWTLDVYNYIEEFLGTKIDGILSNYPSLLAGLYYSKN